MAKRKHPRASKTARGRKNLVAEVAIINGMLGVIMAPVNPVIFQALSSLSPEITTPIQSYFPFLIFPLIIAAGYLFLTKNKEAAAVVGIVTIAFVGIYTFTNRFFISLVTPQAAISAGVPATIPLNYITIGIASVLLIFGVIFMSKR